MGLTDRLKGESHPLVAAIYRTHEDADTPRGHFGASGAGQDCSRKAWLDFRWAMPERFGGRIKRLFESGHREEARVIRDMKKAGVIFAEAKSEQWSFADTECEHFAGSIDGVCKNVPGEDPDSWFLFECKTMNKKAFDRTRAHGIENERPVYYAQVQTYMRWARLKRAIFVIVHKDTDTIYAEIVEYNGSVSQKVKRRALDIIDKPELPDTHYKSDQMPPCMWCWHKEFCHADLRISANVNCRTCVSSTPEPDGSWMCYKKNEDLTEDIQRNGCGLHLMIPSLVGGATPVEAGEGYVKYKDSSGEFANVNSEYGKCDCEVVLGSDELRTREIPF